MTNGSVFEMTCAALLVTQRFVLSPSMQMQRGYSAAIADRIGTDADYVLLRADRSQRSLASTIDHSIAQRKKPWNIASLRFSRALILRILVGETGFEPATS